MFAVCVTFQIHPHRINDFLPLMQANAATSLAVEDGCHLFDVCQTGTEVFLYELYSNAEAFDAHLSMAHFQSFDRATADMIASKEVKTYARLAP